MSEHSDILLCSYTTSWMFKKIPQQMQWDKNVRKDGKKYFADFI